MGATVIELNDKAGRPYRRYNYAVVERLISRRTGLLPHNPKGCPCHDQYRQDDGFGCVSAKMVGMALGVSERQVIKWRSQVGVRSNTADKIASRLGLHPSELWGD